MIAFCEIEIYKRHFKIFEFSFPAMNQRLRPWFARTVYDAVENLKRRKQLLPINKQREFIIAFEPQEVIRLSTASFNSWAHLFPRKPPRWESRTDEPNPTDPTHRVMASPIRVQRNISRPELVIKRPTLSVPEKVSSEFSSPS